MHDNTKLIEWLLLPRRSVYTNSMIKAYIGSNDPYPSTPRTAVSLRQCFELEESFPPIVGGYKTLALRSKPWAKYLDNWEELRALSANVYAGNSYSDHLAYRLELRMDELWKQALEQLTDDDVPLRGVVND